MRRTLAALVIVLGVIFTSSPSAYADMDCPDFATQGEAQAYFEAGGGSPSYNYNRLDNDHDGIACENLPGGGYSAPVEAQTNYVDTSSADTGYVNTTTTTNGAVDTSGVTTNETFNAQSLTETNPEIASCAAYDAWEWAQSAFDKAPNAHQDLDVNGNGVACEHLASGGFAPALWVTGVPENTEPATLVKVVDGNTIEVIYQGRQVTVELQGVVVPTGATCGSAEATAYLQWVLSWVPNGQLHLEVDFAPGYGKQADSYPAYVWFEIGSHAYNANDVIARNGYARAEGTVFNPLSGELESAEAFAAKWQLGLVATCGAIG